MVMATVPAVAFTGSSAEIEGAGSEAGAVTVKLTAFDTAEPTLTVIGSVTGNAMSVGVMSAVSIVELTKAVGRGELFQFTTELVEKFVPVTVRVIPEKLHAEADDPVTVLMTGGTIVNVAPPEVPPPGMGLEITT